MTTNTRRCCLSVLAATMTLSVSADAHEFWIQPAAHIVNQHELLQLSLMHGERYQGEPVARNSPMIRRYELVHPDHEPVPVAGLHGTTDAYLRPEHAGVIVYHTGHYQNNLPAEKFTAYLREEGLGEIEKRRTVLGESDMPGREIYSRCAKSVILISNQEHDASEVDHDTGLPLEIILTQIGSDSETPRVRALIEFDNQPIAGIRVVAASQSDPEQLIELESNAEGIVEFDAKAGTWMLTTLHIVRADSHDHAEWESYWASNTFPIWD